ncbi:hypothetical protein VTH06DRAFT_4219 [Thermothelomyces fergusii]
MRISLSIT